MVNHPPPIPMPNCVCSWAFFLNSRVFARVHADSCGLRGSAGLPEKACFDSPQAIFLSNYATLKSPKVRKGCAVQCYKSTSYARTNQVVCFEHRLATETATIRRAVSKAKCNTVMELQ